MLKIDEEVINIFKQCVIPTEVRAHTSARICSGPVFVEKQGKMLYSKEKTQEAYDKMYSLFLSAYTKENG